MSLINEIARISVCQSVSKLAWHKRTKSSLANGRIANFSCQQVMKLVAAFLNL